MAGAITRTLEPGITYFSAAEIRIVLLPIGEIPDDVFQLYASLVMAHRQVELSNVRSFYKESQKSPFKFFPWKTGNMHFRFLPEDSPAASTSALAPLHSHRKVLGVIGLLSCEHTSDVTRKYKEFEQRCRAFPEATTVRCLAFNPATPTDDDATTPGSKAISPVPEDARACPDLIIFPPSTKSTSLSTSSGLQVEEDDHLINHMEVVMHDFAACVLASLEAWMLNASPSMVSLSTLTDTPEFTGVAVPPYAAEDEAGRTKRKYARLQKSMGDYSLLAGSPLDAVDHYNTAVDLGRASLDYTIAAAAMEGYAAAKLLHAAVSNDAFLTNVPSVFRDESAWRSPRHSISSSTGGAGGGINGEEMVDEERGNKLVSTPGSAEEKSGRDSEETENGGENGDAKLSNLEEKEEGNEGIATITKTATSPRVENSPPRNQQEEQVIKKTISNDLVEEVNDAPSAVVAAPVAAFDGSQFWDALRRSSGLEDEVRSLVDEAKGFIRKRGGLPLLVETDLRWARLLAGLHGSSARPEATELANAVQLAAEMLPLPEDRLIALTESASILGSVGAVRKRVLLMWQAVELSKYFGFPDGRTLAVARAALEPATQHHHEHPLLLSSRNSGSGEILLSSTTTTTTTATSSRGGGGGGNGGSGSGASLSIYNQDWDISRPRPLDQETTIPASWGPVRAGCLEATLGLAIYAKRHADVFDAAAALLREHSKELSAHRMQSLLDNLVAAASQMSVSEKVRPGKGPPPLLHVIGPRAMPAALAPLWIQLDENKNSGGGSGLYGGWNSGDYSPAQSPSSRQNIFLYDPFSAKRQKERNEQRKKQGASNMTALGGGGGAGAGGGNGLSLFVESDSGIQWVSGEPAVVDIEVSNPSSVSIKIDKMVLEAKFIPMNNSTPDKVAGGGSLGAGVAGSSAAAVNTLPQVPVHATKSLWKGKPVSLNIPAHTKPVRIQLEGTPLVPGILILTGCRLTAFGGVSWSQPWTGKPLNLAKKLAEASMKKGSNTTTTSINPSLIGGAKTSAAAAGGGGSGGQVPISSSSDTGNVLTSPSMYMAPIKGPAVTILPPLPRLKLELHSAPSETAAAAKNGEEKGSSPITLLKLMHGQSTSSNLVITNTGAVAVDTLRIAIGNMTASTTDSSTFTKNKNSSTSTTKPGIAVDVDSSTLESLLPLQSGQIISLPVVCRAVGSRFPTTAPTATEEQHQQQQQQQQPLTEMITAEYASASNTVNNNSVSAAAAAREIPGRRVTMEVAVAVAPSLHVSRIEFSEVYQQQQQQQQQNEEEKESFDGTDQDGGGGGGVKSSTICTYERRVVMLADVVNRSTVPLEAWLGPTTTGTSMNVTSSTDVAGTSNNAEKSKHVVVIAPGQRAALSYLVDTEDAAPLIMNGGGSGGNATSSLGNGLGISNIRGRNAVVLRYEEKERQACATSLAERLGLHFKSLNLDKPNGSSGGGGASAEQPVSSIDDTLAPTVISGSLPLIHGEIYNGLTPSVLCMLRSCAIRLRLSIVPLDSEIVPPQQNTTEDTTTLRTTKHITSANMTEAVPLTSAPDGFILVHPPALRSSLGQPLKVNMEVESFVDGPTEVFCSFMCIPIPGPTITPAPGENTNNSTSTTTSAALPDSSSSFHHTINGGGGVLDNMVSQGSLGMYSPGNAGGLGAALAVTANSPGLANYGGLSSSVQTGAGTVATWTGIHSRLQISVPAKGKITHVAGVAVVAPGRFRIGTGHVTVTYPQATREVGSEGGDGVSSKNTLVSVEPCFVAVE